MYWDLLRLGRAGGAKVTESNTHVLSLKHWKENSQKPDHCCVFENILFWNKFRVLERLQKTSKMSTGFLKLAFTNVNILYTHYTIIKTRKLTLIWHY